MNIEDVELTHPLARTDRTGPFYLLFIEHPGWGVTQPVGDWVETSEGTFDFRGTIETELKRLVPPADLPDCITEPVALTAAIDAFNNRTRKHEEDASAWFRQRLAIPRTGDNVDDVIRAFNRERREQFGPAA